MSIITRVQRLTSGVGRGDTKDSHLVRNRFVYMMGALVAMVGVSLRLYLDTMGFSVGTDYYSDEFQVYWMPLLYGELLFTSAFAIGLSAYFWLTRETDKYSISKELELKRYWRLLSVFTVMGLWAGFIASTAIESDAAWHQVTIRDTDFTPTHIIIFYFALPFLTAMLLPAFVWTHTRLPEYMGRVSIPFLGVVFGILMIMPNYGFNEWGHTFFYAEELFAAPIHWGFVFLGWSLFLLIPLSMQIISKMCRLIVETTEGNT